MRNQWRYLLLRRSQNAVVSRHSNHYSLPHYQVLQSPPLPYFSSFIHSPPSFIQQNPIKNISFRSFSSELAVEHKDSDQIAVIYDLFSKPFTNVAQTQLDLVAGNVVVSPDLVLSVLRNPNTPFDVAHRFFHWVFLNETDKLRSNSFNNMLGLLGVNGLVKEFWDLVSVMEKRGYGVHKGTVARVTEKFENEGWSSVLEPLKGLYSRGSNGLVENYCSRVCNLICKGVWDEKVEEKLMELKDVFSSDLVVRVLEKLAGKLDKALIFFRWVEESGVVKHDGRTYNAIVRVLGSEDYLDKFWRVVDEMRGAGFEMDFETYVKLLNGFVKKKLMKDAVDLYEFAMTGGNKPSLTDCTFLLKKIVVGKELDLDLFARVVKVCKEGGNVLTNSMLDTVLKSSNSVGRIGECSRISKAMEEGGLLLSGKLESKIAFNLTSEGEKDEAGDFISSIKASGTAPRYQTWVSLIEGNYVAGHLDKASDCLQQMIEKEGPSSAGYAFELLVTAYCSKKKVMDAFELLSTLVKEKELRPRHTTYKLLTRKLLVQGRFKEAIDLLLIMKSQGYPPFLDPFIKYLSKRRTPDDAIMLMNSMTVKMFPSTAVYVRVFEAQLKAGRHSEAHDFLSRCPGYIRNHADVLDLFCSHKASV